MKQSIINVAAAAALTLACAGAKADAYGTAQLSNFRITLYDIDSSDGTSPYVTFAASAASLADITGQMTTWPIYAPSPTTVTVADSHAGTGEFGPTSAQAAATLAGGSSSVTGSLSTTFSLFSSSYALSDPVSVNNAYGDASLGGGSATSFWLSPGTVMVINATVDLTGQIGSVPGYESGDGSASIALYGDDPSAQSSFVTLSAGTNSFGGTGSLHKNVKVTFTNDGDTAIEGFLKASVSTSAFSQMDSVASVPEPTEAALLLLGLGTLGALARRRRGH